MDELPQYLELTAEASPVGAGGEDARHDGRHEAACPELGETWRIENMGADGSADALVEIDRGMVAIGALEPYDPGPIVSYTSEDGILWMSTGRVVEDDAWPLAVGQHGWTPVCGPRLRDVAFLPDPSIGSPEGTSGTAPGPPAPAGGEPESHWSRWLTRDRGH
jgi:hypothetical protein